MSRHSIFILVFVTWLASTGFAPGAGEVYAKAVRFAKAGQSHFAFMHYSKLLRNYPASKYRKQALFATGEYYFQESGLEKAQAVFNTLLDEFPDAKERLYAFAYLLNIANQNQNELLIEELEKRIIKLQQVSFVFRKTKKINYRSPLHRRYMAIIYIDKIEVYLERELLAKVSY